MTNRFFNSVSVAVFLRDLLGPFRLWNIFKCLCPYYENQWDPKILHHKK